MRDEMDARLWVEHGAAFAEGIDRLIGLIRTTFERIHALEFAAPWKEEAGPVQEHCVDC